MTSIHITKNRFLYFLSMLLLFLSGCTRVDTNSHPVFCQIQENVLKLTGQDVYWDSSLKDSVVHISVEELLKRRLTQDFVVNIALLNNQNLQAIYESLGIAKAHLVQAGLLKNPIFSFSDRFSTNSSIADLLDISLFQNFLEILLIPLKKRMAQAELDVTKSMIITQILDVIAETKIVFYTLQSAEQIWHLKKQILLATELSYEAAQRLFEVGNITDLEKSIERSIYEQAKLEVASWEINVLEAREKLNVLMGLWGRQIDWKISFNFPKLPEEEGDFKNIENEVIANSIDLKIASQELLAIAAGLGIDTTKLVLPQLNVGISSERDDSVWFVGPSFNLAIPFFDFGQANSAKAQAKILQHWNQYTSLAVEIRSKARSSRFTLLNTFRQSQYLQKVMVPLAEQITFSTLLQHNAMQLGVFRLLQAKQRELEKKIQYVHMQRDYWISKTELQILLNGHILYKAPFETPLRKHYK